MPDDPYAPPESKPAAHPGSGFASYGQVPVFRRQWFFWISWFACAPVAIVILVSGDVYYLRSGEVKNFGMANRIVAGLIGVFWLMQIIAAAVATR